MLRATPILLRGLGAGRGEVVKETTGAAGLDLGALPRPFRTEAVNLGQTGPGPGPAPAG